MSLLKIVFMSINFALIDLVTGGKHCTASNHHLSCVYDVADGQPLAVEKGDIRTLDLSGTSITDLERDYISDYANVVEINLSNCGIRSVGNGSFSDLYKLIKLNLSDNLMTTFNVDSFRDVNPLNVLVLSNNLLISLDSFSLDKFPKLDTLDLTEKSVGTEIDPYHQLRQENIISTLEEVSKHKEHL
ncbi:hypothetical protein WA026_014582 [Henosepilachna vigintioctopunctata]|uniref:Uncharacterized protein n=1 Tax=Henosepilachna vigintioctopunctata TaxID=420089 RepID=A0AAW1V9E4_9CUCU